MEVIAVVNESTLVTDADFQLMVEAVNRQIRYHVAPAWNRVPAIVMDGNSEVPPGAFVVALLEDSDQANALGYHAVTPAGVPYGRVFAKPVLDNGGAVLTGPLSVSSVLSHEVCELFGDEFAGYWADKGDGTAVALELCDQVEGDSYEMWTAPIGGVPVMVSNWLLPEAFNPTPPAGSRFDHMGTLAAPFSMSSGGYTIVMQQGQVSQVFADRATYPAWKLAGKSHPASRTARRMKGATI